MQQQSLHGSLAVKPRTIFALSNYSTVFFIEFVEGKGDCNKGNGKGLCVFWGLRVGADSKLTFEGARSGEETTTSFGNGFVYIVPQHGNFRA